MPSQVLQQQPQPQQQNDSEGLPTYLPLAVIDKSIGSRVLIIMKSQKEFSGILRGFDEYLNMVLDEVCEYSFTPEGDPILPVRPVESMLLSAANIAIFVPTTKPVSQ